MTTQPTPVVQPFGSSDRCLGILGGLGPHAHVAFEQRLLAEAARRGARADQDYPPWVVVSVPQAPDRTQALVADGPSPAPVLARGLERLRAAGAHVAVVPCVTAHAFLDGPQAPIPLVHLVRETVPAARERFGDAARLGILATTGTLEAGLFQSAAADAGLHAVSLLDTDLDPDPTGALRQAQDELVMFAIYGLKTGAAADPATGRPYRDALAEAAKFLDDAAGGIDAVIAGCTEIGMALADPAQVDGVPVLDPLTVAAHACCDIVAGLRPLPA